MHVGTYTLAQTHTQPQGSNCWGLSRKEVTIKMPLAHSHCVRQGESLDNKKLALQSSTKHPLQQPVLSVISPFKVDFLQFVLAIM